MSQYRAGIIGLGFVGVGDPVAGERLGQQVSHLDGTHLEALSKHPRIQVVAGCSLDAGQRERFSQRTGAAVFADWREMLDRERPDIVSVATWTPMHAELTIGCAEHGVRAVYCEKPIATCVAEGERMLAACRQAGTLLVINHNRRFNPNYRRLQELVGAAELGELTSVNLQWGNGRLGNTGTHLIDAVRMLTGREVQAVSGTLDLADKPDCRGPQFRDPGGWGLLRLEGGLMTTLDAADYARVPGRVVVNGTQGRAITGGADVLLEYWDGHEEHWPSLRHEATSMDHAVAEIVACLDEGTPFSYAAAEAVRTLEAIVGLHVSHDRQAAWVELPLTDADRHREVLSG